LQVTVNRRQLQLKTAMFSAGNYFILQLFT
jgi:hypothetical protein